MRAVNLIPGDHRRGGGRGGARSGIGAYVVLGVLGALVVGAASYVLTANQVKSRQGELAKASVEADGMERQAAALKPYADFATLSQTRVATVASLASSRFDWERALRELARAMPGDVWLTSMVGTVAPGVSFEGAGGSGQSTSSLRSAMEAPAIELVGCTESQAGVSRVMSRLRTMKGVQRVALSSSEKTEAAAGAGGGGTTGGGASSDDCRNGSASFPQFQIVVFFTPPPAAGTSSGQGGTTAPQTASAQGAQAAASQPVANGAGAAK